MTTVKALQKIVLPFVASLTILAFYAASAQAAPMPWWHLSTQSAPPGPESVVVDDAVNGGPPERGGQGLVNERETVTLPFATAGAFTLALAGESTVPLPYDATAVELREALERLAAIGPANPANVSVSGSPGGPWSVEFTGSLADRHVGDLTGDARDLAGEGKLIVEAANLGTGPANRLNEPVTLTDHLPPGLEPTYVQAESNGSDTLSSEENNSGATQPVPPLKHAATCTLEAHAVSCRFPDPVFPYEHVFLVISVRLSANAADSPNEVAVSGGLALPATSRRPLAIAGPLPPAGIQTAELSPEEEGGAPATRAGSHPFQFTTTLALNLQATAVGKGGVEIAAAEGGVGQLKLDLEPIALARDVNVELPPGLLGNPQAIPTCPIGVFTFKAAHFSDPEAADCPPASIVGVTDFMITTPAGNNRYSPFVIERSIYNLEPAYGEPARFGVFVGVSPTAVILDPSLRDNGDYGVTVSSRQITQVVGFLGAQLTFWGAPGSPAHDAQRSLGCLGEATWHSYVETGSELSCPLPNPEPPFLALPTSCAGPLLSSITTDSWQHPGELAPFELEPLPALDACNRVPFSPTIQAEASTDRASAPSGLDFNVDFTDEGLLNPTGVAQSQLKDTVVTLPEGLTINPSAGVGLGGCTPADYERETLESAPGAGCPNDSKLGTVEIETPLLTQKIHGSLFIAQPYENPFPEPEAGHPNGTLVALYVVAKNPETGVMIKLAGKVTPNPLTGRLTTTFLNSPQLPFSHFNFHFREGQQAPLISPPACGTYAVQASLTPWSEPTTALTDTSSFQITKGFEGGECPSGGVAPFHPGIQSGMQNNNAGVFSPFYLHLTRTDGEQEISGFSTDLPPGLTGSLTGIPFCPEADIALARTKTGGEEEANPSCPAASQIGHTLVGTGVGAVLAYVPGKLYLAGPFHGAPFSLVAVTSAVVGPFDLGTVVLRFGLNIDPYTAQVSVSPTSSEPIPTIIDGIVTHVRDIRVYVERPGNAPFTLNPTSCSPMAIGSTLSSPIGASATVTSPFQAASCANLAFKPAFKVSTSGKTSRQTGASLHVLLTYPKAPVGTQANIKSVKVDLPKQLPSRLTTLQKACTAAQFEANPAGCPAASIVGHAKAMTPILPVPLEGPAYFVSYGGAKFPELVIVLQGYGVTIDLHGETFINKAGITSSTFHAIPDEPVTSFELTLPQGPDSALAANGNLCSLTRTVLAKRKVTVRVKGHNKTVTRNVRTTLPASLTMPTAFTAQNGMVIKQSTPISVTGCGKTKAKASRRGQHKHK